MKAVQIQGIEILVEEADLYLQINDIAASDLVKIWSTLCCNFSAYDKFFTFHNMEVPVDVLKDISAVIVDDNVELRLNKKTNRRIDCSDVVQISTDNFELFAKVHDKIYPNIYWNSERIRKDFERWGIFAMIQHEEVSGYILILIGNQGAAEIFSIYAKSNENGDDLMNAAVVYAFDYGKTEVLFMADPKSMYEKCALNYGFEQKGFYKGYVVYAS